jgi:dienelactone hydrolase
MSMAQETQIVSINTADAKLEGNLTFPAHPHGIVLFAHGSGSSRFSSRNRYVAEVLQQGGLATLLFDLLTAEEHTIDEVTRELRFDIPLLSRRLIDTIDWLTTEDGTKSLRIGLFGASTGAAAALIAAAERPQAVMTVVSRGGRPDLARDYLPKVKAPTLLIIGSLDQPVITMNRDAARQMQCEHHIEIVPGATHLFAEPGRLELVAELARNWFVERLG